VLTAYRRFLDSRSREADADERQALLARARGYALAHGVADQPRVLTFRAGPPWMLWLAGDWDALLWLWSELQRRFSGDDVWEIFPDTGPLAAAVRLEREGPEVSAPALHTAVERQARSGTWHARVASAAHLANLELAEGQASAALARLHALFSARSPQALDLPSFLLAARVVGPAALLAPNRGTLAPWAAADNLSRSDGAMFAAALDHLSAVERALAADTVGARELLSGTAATYARLGWEHLAAELAWQRARVGDESGLDGALAFYRARGAEWRVRWLEEGRWR